MAVVKVAASTAIETSVPPSSAASCGDLPISMWRKMFSSTMTPLSMRREKTSASPPRIMVLMEPPMELVNQQADQHRKRNRQQHGDGGARAAQEDQNHDPGQHQPDARFARYVADGQLDEDRLVEDHGGLAASRECRPDA